MVDDPHANRDPQAAPDARPLHAAAGGRRGPHEAGAGEEALHQRVPVDIEEPERARPIHPQAMEDADFERRVARIERFAHLMDRSIELPIVKWRMGLDGLIGLIPGVGDTVAAAASSWLVAEGWRLGARKRVMARMLANLGIDWAVGLVPLVGDILDIGYKANAKNAHMLVHELRHRRKAMRDRPLPFVERRAPV
jgi:hypothetical protein